MKLISHSDSVLDVFSLLTQPFACQGILINASNSCQKSRGNIQNIYQLVRDVPQLVRISAGYKQPGQLYWGLPAKKSALLVSPAVSNPPGCPGISKRLLFLAMQRSSPYTIFFCQPS